MGRVFVAGAVVALVFMVTIADEVVRFDFEQGHGIWRLPGECWKVEDGNGCNGTKCLTLSIQDWQKVKWPSTEKFAIAPGSAYRLDAWIDVSQFHLPKGFVHVGIAFYDDNGNVVLDSIAIPLADNEVRADGWRRYGCTTRTVPASARTAGLYIWTPDGSTGAVRFDDIEVKPMLAKPLDALCVSAYRAEADAGEVRFAAGYYLNPYKHDLKTLKADFRYVSKYGVRTVPATLADSVASATIPVQAFAMGTNTVTLTIRDGNGTKIDESSCSFARLPTLPRRKVTFDQFHRTLVDGKPFFPLGMYSLDITAADIATYTNGPFNCIMPYRFTDESKLDICAAAGVRVIYPVNESYEELDKASPEQRKKIEKNIYGKVRRFKNHPAIMAWYTADEIREPYTYLLEERNNAIHTLDPDHPTWIVIYNSDHVRSFVRGYDVIGMDPYPIGNRGLGRAKIGIAAGWAKLAQKGMYGCRPMWHVPQAFDWGYYRPAETNDAAVRLPTLAEMHSMTWQAVAAGANGLVFYSFHDLLKRDNWPKERVSGGWENVCNVAREVKAKEPVLLSEPGPAAICKSEDVVCRTWRTGDGAIHLLACNMIDKDVKTEVRIGDRSIQLSVLPIGVEWRRIEKRQ